MSAMRYVLLTLAVILLAGCAASRYHSKGMDLLSHGQFDEGVESLARAVQEDPGNARYRLDLLLQKERQINQWFSQADTQRDAQQWDAAEVLYKRILTVEPANVRAQDGLSAASRDRHHVVSLQQAREALERGDLDSATSFADVVQLEDPTNSTLRELRRQIDEEQLRQAHVPISLEVKGSKSVSLSFTEANTRLVLEALARSSGIGLIFDKDVPQDLRTTINLEHVAPSDAIDLLLQTSRLHKKVLNSTTVLIYPDTPDKLGEYQELVVKGFYLSNADAKQVDTLLRSLLKVKDTYVDERLNMVVLRDTPETIRLAEKLVAMQDIHEPEVMLELSVMEVTRSRLTELGIDWPDQVTVSPLSATGAAAKTLLDLKSLNASRIGISPGSANINLRRELADANLLANPRIRVQNREKANILIGDKVPVLTSTANSTGFVSENVQYLDVGLKLNVVPTVYLQGEVAIKVGLEVSSIVKEVTTQSGVLTYQIGTRTAETTLRLNDGETQVLAGLINAEDRSSANRIPGLGDLPLLSRLFGSQQDSRQKTEIVLSITPHIIRNVNRPGAAGGEFWSGTATSLRTKPLLIRSASEQKVLDSPQGQNQAETKNSSEVDEDSDSPLSNAVKVEPLPTKIALSWKGPATAKVGESVQAILRVNSDGGLRAMPLQIAVDPEAFRVVKIEEGNFFRQKDGSSSFTSNIDVEKGKVFIGASRNGVHGVRGEDDLVILTLKPVKTKAGAKLEVLSASPLAGSGSAVSPTLPDPLSIDIAE